MKKFLSSCLFLLCSTCALQATPNEIVIFRHAEKSNQENFGANQHRHKFMQMLSPEGWDHAEQIAGLLSKRYSVGQDGTNKVLLFADRPSLFTSSRAEQTLIPTACAFHLPIITYYGKHNVDELVELLRDERLNGKNIVIAWEREGLNTLARRAVAMATDGEVDVDDYGNDDSYNKVGLITFNKGAATFRVINENELAKPIRN